VALVGRKNLRSERPIEGPDISPAKTIRETNWQSQPKSDGASSKLS
jgi:hypothetical protein